MDVYLWDSVCKVKFVSDFHMWVWEEERRRKCCSIGMHACWTYLPTHLNICLLTIDRHALHNIT